MKASGLALLAIFLIFAPLTVAADSLNKAYFSETPVGSWASYSSSNDAGGSYKYTYLRVPDQNGCIAIEFTLEILTDPGKGTKTTQLYVMDPDFDFSKNALEYMKHVKFMIFQAGKMDPMVYSNDVVKTLKEGSCGYSDVFSFLKKEKIEDHLCDKYSFQSPCGGPNPTVNKGELWLDEKVPFGVIKETINTYDKDNKKIGSSNRVLTDFGQGKEGTAALLEKIPQSAADQK